MSIFPSLIHSLLYLHAKQFPDAVLLRGVVVILISSHSYVSCASRICACAFLTISACP